MARSTSGPHGIDVHMAVFALHDRIAWLEQELSSARRRVAFLTRISNMRRTPSDLPPSTTPTPPASSSPGPQAVSDTPAKRKRQTDPVDSRKAAKTTGYPKGSIAPLRRPIRKDTWYSRYVGSDEHWANVSPDRQRALSHVGYIEETEAGIVAPTPCYSCASYRRPLPGGGTEKQICMTYKPEVASKYTKALGNNWKACSSCWLVQRPCEFTRDPETGLLWQQRGASQRKPKQTES